jgi:hypothetical protein
MTMPIPIQGLEPLPTNILETDIWDVAIIIK